MVFVVVFVDVGKAAGQADRAAGQAAGGAAQHAGQGVGVGVALAGLPAASGVGVHRRAGKSATQAGRRDVWAAWAGS